MAKAGITRVTIPKPLLDAKNSAAAEFLSPDTGEVLTAFLARPNPQHKLAGENYVGRVLVLDAAKGGVATAWMLHEMKARGIVPAALVLNAINPIMVQGAALADFTMISGFDQDITQVIPNGAPVEVDPTAERPFIRIV